MCLFNLLYMNTCSKPCVVWYAKRLLLENSNRNMTYVAAKHHVLNHQQTGGDERK